MHYLIIMIKHRLDDWATEQCGANGRYKRPLPPHCSVTLHLLYTLTHYYISTTRYFSVIKMLNHFMN